MERAVERFGTRPARTVALAACAAAFALSCGCSFVSMTDYENMRKKADTAETVNKQLTAKLDELEARCESLQAKLRALGDLRGQLEEKDKRIAELQATLNEAISKRYGQVIPIEPGESGFEVNPETRGVILSADAVTFASGQAEIREAYKGRLRKLAERIREADPQGRSLIYVDGHTDRQPVRRTVKVNIDNWFLGARRAHAVMRFLRDECRFPKERFVLTSWGYLREIQKGVEKSEKNRRVEIRLIRRETAGPTSAEPPK